MFVTSVDKVVINAHMNSDTGEYEGDEVDPDDIECSMGSGIVRIFDVGCVDRKSKIFIKYNAGYSDAQISAIKELLSNGVTRALTSSYGVTSEAAGGVSVSYNSSWAGRGSTALTDDTREVLETYKVKGVF